MVFEDFQGVINQESHVYFCKIWEKITSYNFVISKSPSLHSLHLKKELGKFILNFSYKLEHVIC